MTIQIIPKKNSSQKQVGQNSSGFGCIRQLVKDDSHAMMEQLLQDEVCITSWHWLLEWKNLECFLLIFLPSKQLPTNLGRALANFSKNSFSWDFDALPFEHFLTSRDSMMGRCFDFTAPVTHWARPVAKCHPSPMRQGGALVVSRIRWHQHRATYIDPPCNQLSNEASNQPDT